MFSNLPPLSLYIHVPWCVKKCPYCDFNSHQSDLNDLPQQQYLDQLIADLTEQKAQALGRKLTSIFIGGGTPSVMDAWFYQELLPAINNIVPFADDIEITMEANPGTFEIEKFSGFKEAGINRLSLGVQSFEDDKLAVLGRIHSGNNAVEAIKAAQSIGFDNVNIDLMFGLSKQSIEQALADLQQAIDLNTKHISWYQLTIEQNTEYFRKPPPLPQHDLIFEMQEKGQALLKANGFSQYEISAYSKPNSNNTHQAKHNVNYWQFGDYIGIGAGAHGKLSDNKNNVVRTKRTRLPKDYLNKPLKRIDEAVPQDELLFEVLMNGLRLKNGISWQLVEQYTGQSKQQVAKKLGLFEQQKLINLNHQNISLTDKGYWFLDEILKALV